MWILCHLASGFSFFQHHMTITSKSLLLIYLPLSWNDKDAYCTCWKLNYWAGPESCGKGDPSLGVLPCLMLSAPLLSGTLQTNKEA